MWCPPPPLPYLPFLRHSTELALGTHLCEINTGFSKKHRNSMYYVLFRFETNRKMFRKKSRRFWIFNPQFSEEFPTELKIED